MQDITIEEFISTVFPPEELAPDEVPLISHPYKDYYVNKTATVRNCRSADRQPQGWVYCVSSVDKPEPGAFARRTLGTVRRAFAIVLDDIGTKAKAPPVAPSYILETSKGNFQYGYLLEPFNVNNAQGQVYFDGCLMGLAEAGYSDPGVRSASRVVKLPGALHSSGFHTVCHLWDPVEWALPALMKAMDVKPVKRARGVKALRPGKHSVLDDVDDPVYDWLVERGVIDGNNDQWTYLPCPWQAGHTDAARGARSSTAYSPLDYGRGGRAFNCMHGSCQVVERNTEDFLTWVAEQGGPNILTTCAPMHTVLSKLLEPLNA
jgi:hypothetical protein